MVTRKDLIDYHSYMYTESTWRTKREAIPGEIRASTNNLLAFIEDMITLDIPLSSRTFCMISEYLDGPAYLASSITRMHFTWLVQ